MGEGYRDKIGETSLKGENTKCGGLGKGFRPRWGCKEPSPEVGVCVECPRTVG